MPRRTKDEALKTRDTIIDAAEVLFFERGVSHTSLEEIAARAGVTRGAVYWHFKDKPDLFDAMTQRVFLPFEDLMQKLVDRPSPTPLEDLKNASIGSLKMLATDSRQRNVLSILLFRCEYVDEMHPIVERRQASQKKMLALSEKLFKRAKALKMLAPWWSPRQAAVAMQAFLGGLILSGLERQPSDLATVGVACVENFFHSLQAP